MATFCVEIADEQVDRVLNALCANYQYRDQISNPDFDPSLEEDPENNSQTIDNPESKYQFGNRIVREYLINNTQAYEIQLAKKQAMDNINIPPMIMNPST